MATSWSSARPWSDPYQLSGSQIAELNALSEMKPQGQSIWDDIKHGTKETFWDPISWGLRQIMRPSYGVAGGVLASIDQDPNTNFGSGFKEGFIKAKPVGFGQVLEEKGVLKNHDILRGLAGFGLDVVTDPTNALFIAAAPVTGGASLAALAAKHGVAKGTLEKGIGVGKTLIHSDDAEELSKGLDELRGIWNEKNVDRLFGPQKVYAELKLSNLYKQGRVHPDYQANVAAQLEEIAKVTDLSYASAPLIRNLYLEGSEDAATAGLRGATYEPGILRQFGSTAYRSQQELTRDMRRLRLELGVPFTSGRRIPIVTTPFKPMSLSRVAEGESWINSVPLVGDAAKAAAGSLGRTFVGGFGNRVAWSSIIMGKKMAERLGDEYTRNMQERFREFADMDDEDKFEAIRFATSANRNNTAHGGIVSADGVLNEEMLDLVSTKGYVVGGKSSDSELEEVADDMGHLYQLSPEQVAYIRAYHKIGVDLFELDRAHSVDYLVGAEVKEGRTTGTIWENEGVVYVPAPYTKLNVPLDAGHMRSMLSDASYQFDRQKGLTYRRIEMIRDKLQQTNQLGRTKLVEWEDFHPETLLLRRGRRAAQKHADVTAEDALVYATGIPKYDPNVASLIKLREKESELVRLSEQFIESTGGHSPDDALNAAFVAKLEQDILTRVTNEMFEGMEDRWVKIVGETDAARQQRLVDSFDDREVRLLGAVYDKVGKQVKASVESILAQRAKFAKDLNENRAAQMRASTRGNKIFDDPQYQHYVDHPRSRIIDTDFFGQPIYYKIPFKISEMLSRKESLTSNAEELAAFDKGFGQVMRLFKTTATIVNPQYRVRNTLSDMWAQWLLGMNPKDMVKYHTLAHHKLQAAKKGDSKAQQLYVDAYDNSVLSGFFEADIYKARKAIKVGHDTGWLRFAVEFNRYPENLSRMATYLYMLERTGGDKFAAADAVRFGHFDYEDLTEVEAQRFKKFLAPFYTWTRKNVPFQLEALLTRPGRFSAFPKFAQEMEYAAGGGEGDILPEYLQNNMAFKIPGLGYMPPPIGAVDISMIEHPSRLMDIMGPQISVPIEILTGKRIPGGFPIQGTHPRSPVASWLGALKGVPGLDVGTTERFVGGQEMQGVGASPWLAWAAEQTPITNLLVNTLSPIKQAQRGPQPLGVPSWFTGLATYTPDVEQGKAIASARWDDYMKRVLRGIRDENRMLEAQNPMSPFTRRVNNMVYGVYDR